MGERDAAFVRGELARAVRELPGSYDLVPGAVARGRRRRARGRAGMAAGAVGLVALGWFAAPVVLPGRGTVAVDSSAFPSASPSAVPESSVEPDAEYLAMTDAERQRLAVFKAQAARILDAELPAGIGRLTADGRTAATYTGRAGDRAFPVVFYVRPREEGTGPPCRDSPETGLTCERLTLPGGIGAKFFGGPDPDGLTVRAVEFRYGRSEVRLALNPDVAAKAPAPVTVAQLRAAVSAPAFLDLVRGADAEPVMTEWP
ncbi:hypothetical protein SRB5_58800 [Streptomyces sp. RB5]|uniref:Uncharacterized protein n=1 Tax=Streptomyces smaragdinus TaxID=2585196 RepID=A0A7K0CRS7_9ACTN|nr:hypothetical protein [Streptomyces smaragdinus]MQY15692.1 hypothetical protein [Streptomyces smaragdinus]